MLYVQVDDCGTTGSSKLHPRTDSLSFACRFLAWCVAISSLQFVDPGKHCRSHPFNLLGQASTDTGSKHPRGRLARGLSGSWKKIMAWTRRDPFRSLATTCKHTDKPPPHTTAHKFTRLMAAGEFFFLSVTICNGFG